MSIAKASYPFDIVRNDDQTDFTYKKGKLGFKTIIPMLWPSLILSIYLAYKKILASPIFTTPSEKFSMGVFYAIFYTIVIAIGVVIILNLLRRPGSFSFNKQGVLLNGTLYPYGNIHSLYIKTPRGETAYTLTGSARGFIVVGNDRVQTIGLGTAAIVGNAASGVVSAASQVSNAAGRGIANSIREKSYKICFIYGNSEKVIARQITERTALLLMKEINSLSNQ